MSAVDRMSEGYVPDFDIDYEVGKQGQLYVARIIDSISANRHEVKTDERYLQTGNVYLECQCLTRGGWSPSGIASTEADMWWHVIGEAVIVATADQVRAIARHHWGTRYQKECTRGSHPTRGIVLPVGRFIHLLSHGLPDVGTQLQIDRP